MEGTEKQLCYIMGAIPRCGSNFLFRIIMEHPNCGRVNFNTEDKILVNSQLINNYVFKTSQSWISKDNVDKEQEKKRLVGLLTNSIFQFFDNPTHDNDIKCICTKTPLTNGINNFFKFFPGQKLVILIRDGKDAVESGFKSFGVPYKYNIREYRDSLKRIDQFLSMLSTEERSNVLIVKYEDIVLDIHQETKKVLTFLNLNVSNFPFEKLDNFPVKGSSASRKSLKDRISWQQNANDPKEFNPLNRSDGWDKRLRRYYEAECGLLSSKFGYESKFEKLNIFQKIDQKLYLMLIELNNARLNASRYPISKMPAKIYQRVIRSFKVLINGYD